MTTPPSTDYQFDLPGSDEVLRYVDADADTDPDLITLAAARVPVVREYVRALTRGQGFDADGQPCPALAAVITTAAAREITTPEGIQREEIGSASFYYGPNAHEFSLREMMIIRSFRRMAC